MMPPPGRRPGTPPPEIVLTPDGPLVAPTRSSRARRGRLQRLPPELVIPALPPDRTLTPPEELACAQFESESGGRQTLVAVLATTGLSKAEDRLLGLLADPLNDRVSLAQLCRQAHVGRERLLNLYRTATLTRGQIRAIGHVAAHLPRVAEGVMKDATPGIQPCPICGGLGLVHDLPTDDGAPTTKACGVCKGTGLVEHRPDPIVRKLALDMGKMLERPSGPSTKVVVQQSQQQGMVGGQYSKLMSAVDAVLYGEGRQRTESYQGNDLDPPGDEG